MKRDVGHGFWSCVRHLLQIGAIFVYTFLSPLICVWSSLTKYTRNKHINRKKREHTKKGTNFFQGLFAFSQLFDYQIKKWFYENTHPILTFYRDETNTPSFDGVIGVMCHIDGVCGILVGKLQTLSETSWTKATLKKKIFSDGNVEMCFSFHWLSYGNNFPFVIENGKFHGTGT
jgi:hypothetical protein